VTGSQALAGRLHAFAVQRLGPGINDAVLDILDGLKNWRLWSLLAWQDIRLRYRRSMLGPFWLTLSMAIQIAALGFVYGKLFHMELTTYLPYLTVGFLAWGFISTNVIDGCAALTLAEPFIRQISLPFSVHIFRSVYRNLIIFAHNFVVYLVVILVFGISPGVTGLLLFPATLALIVLNAIWATLLFAMICSRFRDLGPIIASLLQVGFFLTPILWRPELLNEHRWLVYLNPIYHLVELLRAPMIGNVPGLTSCIAVVLVTVTGWGVTLAFFGRFRNRIAYWV
jgi:ABC-type polysaccharide/polyol phosphate export permease